MGRVFAVADLHGMIELYQQIKDFLKPEDKVYCLGDMGDRGTDCWETIKAIMNDSQFICLKGNHEDLLVNAMQVWLGTPSDEREFIWGVFECCALARNGGRETLEGWAKEPLKERKEWYKRIAKLPTHIEYKNKNDKWIYMSHAGFTPYSHNVFPDDEHLMWDRDHFMYSWPHDAPTDVIILHGHTPIQYLIEERYRFSREIKPIPTFPCAYWYSGTHKCCIDNGSFYEFCTVLLDLDTFEEHKFYTSDYKGGKNG